jgi:hypothetical protein
MKNQSSNLKIKNETAEKDKQNLHLKMPTVTCTCGAKILVVPDLAAMGRAIKNHKAKHKKADEEFLIQQILEATSQQALL